MKAPALLEFPDEQILAAFAAIMLGSSPLDPPPDATAIAAMASRLAEPRPARRPGDVEGTRAFRSVYSLAREQDHPPKRDGYRADRSTATRAWIVLESAFDLRHRQRAAIALRYVFGLPNAHVARVLGLSQTRAAEVLRAATANVAKGAGGRVDVARHLRTIGGMVRTNGRPSHDGETVGEARSVVKLLLSPVADAAATRGRTSGLVAPPIPRPVYRVRDPEGETPRLSALVPEPAAPARPKRRTGLLVAACLAALAFLATFTPGALLRPSGRVPLATVPVAPIVQEATTQVLDAPAPVFAYRVRPGDTLWSIAGTVLGDAGRWPEVWRSNAGRLMSEGVRFVDPNLIQPGWRLRVPQR